MNETAQHDPPCVQTRLRQSWRRLPAGIAIAFVLWFIVCDVQRTSAVKRIQDSYIREIETDREAWYELIQAARNGQREALEAVLPRTGRAARTQALRIAVTKQHVDLIAPLMAAGVDLETRFARNRTPLMLAGLYGNRDCVAALLQAGADPRLKDSDGKTARDLALAGGEHEIARLIDGAFSMRRNTVRGIIPR